MKGARPILDEEIALLKKYFSIKEPHRNDNRDKTFILLGLYTGFRCSELLSIRLKDVWNGFKVTDYINCRKRDCKGKIQGKTTPIFQDCKDMLEYYVKNHCKNFEYLFQSIRGGPLSYRQMLRCIKSHFNACELTGNLSSHSLRKTFAHKMYKELKGDLPGLQACLNHKSINSTVSYVSVNHDKIVEGIKNLNY
jgi:integrase